MIVEGKDEAWTLDISSQCRPCQSRLVRGMESSEIVVRIVLSINSFVCNFHFQKSKGLIHICDNLAPLYLTL